MALWFATRAFGLMSLALFSTVVVLGLLTAGRRAPLRQAFVVAGLHRSLSLLSLAFLGLHIATGVLDGYVTIRWADAVVPFISDYRPFWLGLGAIAGDIVLVLIITSLLRVRLGLRAWRAVHWLAYACWPIAVVHALGTGTDRGLSLALAAGCGLAVTITAGVRLAAVPRAAAARDSAGWPTGPATRSTTGREAGASGVAPWRADDGSRGHAMARRDHPTADGGAGAGAGRGLPRDLGTSWGTR